MFWSASSPTRIVGADVRVGSLGRVHGAAPRDFHNHSFGGA